MFPMAVRARLVCEGNILSRSIAWFSQGHLSHAEAQRDDGMCWGARDDHVGGKPPGVQLRPPDYAVFTREIVFTIPSTPLQEQSFWAWWESQEGKPYDSRAIWGFAFNRTWHSPGWWICSAALVASLQSIDVLEWDLYLPDNKNTPVMAAQLVSGIKGVTQSGPFRPQLAAVAS
jgi:hypothetical protein